MDLPTGARRPSDRIGAGRTGRLDDGEPGLHGALGVMFVGLGMVDSDAKCNPVDSIGSSTKSRVSHSERRPSARFPGDKDGSARRNIEPLQ